jgi:DnaJ like chaperone protein
MSIYGKLAGAAAGLYMGGPLGALLGSIAGHYFIDKELPFDPDKKPEDQVAFSIGIIALSAKMAKADGVVTRDEITAFRQIFKVPPEDSKNVGRLFDRAKQSVAGFEAYAGQLAGLFNGRLEVLEDVVDGLFHIAKADGVLHPAELSYLENVATIFGFSSDDFIRIKARHMEPDQRDPYVMLGVSRDESSKYIKHTYRKLVAQNHPDKLMARGVPEEAIVIANEKLAAINSAYDEIVKERGSMERGNK